MKKLLIIITLFLVGCKSDQTRENATWSFDSSTGNYIEWQSDNDFANEMTNAAFGHIYNIEFEKAVVFFEKAISYDPSLFRSPRCLSWNGSCRFCERKNAY